MKKCNRFDRTMAHYILLVEEELKLLEASLHEQVVAAAVDVAAPWIFQRWCSFPKSCLDMLSWLLLSSIFTEANCEAVAVTIADEAEEML